MWIVQHSAHGLWAGNQWTHALPLATEYEDPDKALTVADAFHLADCSFDHAKARETCQNMKCTVRNKDTGETYQPPALVNSKHIYARINWRKVRSS